MSATISAQLVKELREKTGAGMMECKKALTDANGDLEGAIKLLRESGAAKAAKRESRTAAEGLIGISGASDNKSASIVELNCETDFVARNEDFQKLLEALSNAGLAGKVTNAEALGATKLPEFGKTGQEAVSELLARIGEKISLSRADYVEGDYVATYVHPPGKIGTVVAVKLDGAKATDEFVDTLRGICMHVAARGPLYLNESEIDPAILEKEREIAANIARNEGKPEAVLPKIVEGKVKFYISDNCLLFQEHVMHAKQTVKQVLDAAAKQAGGAAAITRFIRFKVGESAVAAEEAAE